MIFWKQSQIKSLFILPITVYLVIASCTGQKHSSSQFNIHSTLIHDNFEIYIDSHLKHNPGDSFKVLYYLDANLNSGKALREIFKDSNTRKQFENTLFVGIGHIGGYRTLRRRDFLVPEILNGDTVDRSENYGHAERFYQFLKLELIPFINSEYSTYTDSNSILGHSFGGLFSVYCLLKNDSLFQNFYALSPSLWVNNGAIYDHDHLTANSKNNYYLFMSVGGLETLNRVKPATDKFQNYISNKNFPYLRMEYRIYKGKNHYSQVNNSFSEIFKE